MTDKTCYCKHKCKIDVCPDIKRKGYCLKSKTNPETKVTKLLRCEYCLRKRGEYDEGCKMHGIYYCDFGCAFKDLQEWIDNSYN